MSLPFWTVAFRAFDPQTVFTGFQFGLAQLCVLGDVDRLGKRLRECRYRQSNGGQQSDTAENNLVFMRVNFFRLGSSQSHSRLPLARWS